MESAYDDIFKNDVKSLKRDNLHLKLLVQQKMKQINGFKQENLKLKLRVQQEEHDMNTVKQMLKRIIIDDKKIRDEKIQNEKALVIQNHWKIRIIKKNNIKNFYTQYIFFKKWRYNIELSLRRKNAQYITCTPINLKNECFKEQHDKFDKQNCQMKWDDTFSNNSIIGNLFAFIKSDNNMKIHWITKIGDKTDREKHWTERERNVIFLSKKYFTMTWNDYKEKNGYKETFRMIGTQRLKWKY